MPPLNNFSSSQCCVLSPFYQILSSHLCTGLFLSSKLIFISIFIWFCVKKKHTRSSHILTNMLIHVHHAWVPMRNSHPTKFDPRPHFNRPIHIKNRERKTKNYWLKECSSITHLFTHLLDHTTNIYLVSMGRDSWWIELEIQGWAQKSKLLKSWNPTPFNEKQTFVK